MLQREQQHGRTDAGLCLPSVMKRLLVACRQIRVEKTFALKNLQPAKHRHCLPDMRAMPKQQELQSARCFHGKVNGAMIK